LLLDNEALANRCAEAARRENAKTVRRRSDSNIQERSNNFVARHMGHKEAVQAGNEDVFAINTARVMGAGFLATTLGTSVVKSESLDIRGILASIVTLIAPMDRLAALFVGTVWHCLNGIVFAAIYARLLIALRKQSTVGTRVLLGVELWILLMLTLPILFSTAPPVRSADLPNPGVFLLHTSMGRIESLFNARS
jgi:hypothetical protein